MPVFVNNIKIIRHFLTYIRNMVIPQETVIKNQTKIFLLCDNLQCGIINHYVRKFRRLLMIGYLKPHDSGLIVIQSHFAGNNLLLN